MGGGGGGEEEKRREKKESPDLGLNLDFRSPFFLPPWSPFSGLLDQIILGFFQVRSKPMLMPNFREIRPYVWLGRWYKHKETDVFLDV